MQRALLVDSVSQERAHPLDVIERFAEQNEWNYERQETGDEITFIVSGHWAEYQLSCTWMEGIDAIHVACAFDLKVQKRHVCPVRELLALINERLWIGHFDMWQEEGTIMFRHALPLGGGAASEAQCRTMIGTACESCEKYFVALQFVLWAGKTPKEALEAALFETKGEA